MIWYCLMSHLLVCMGGLQVNIEKSKMMISGEETWKVRKKGNFFCAVFRKIIGSSSFLGQFCKYWEHRRCNAVGGRLKLHYEFKCGICASQKTDTGKELIGQSRVVKNFCSFVGAIEVRGSEVDSVFTKNKEYLEKVKKFSFDNQ